MKSTLLSHFEQIKGRKSIQTPPFTFFKKLAYFMICVGRVVHLRTNVFRCADFYHLLHQLRVPDHPDPLRSPPTKREKYSISQFNDSRLKVSVALLVFL
jgi:hypothetical protein